MLMSWIFILYLVKLVERYGVVATITGDRCSHAAYGRARRTERLANSHRDTLCRAADLVSQLRAERLAVA
ncbi:hypothetical protein [Micromonospora sp. NBC_01796]|uniref:hypothetical protein n=1 Tax=Micromonospora sp. NBC_01796 TaxID=2975987 RepID=UPI002DD83000|nr:hypothetical protein [Micromonospora sp. NBC_01796]WSA88086.1 hypothetical protein OIE47_11005 [Micromonospora sp. NBC_01796]